MFRLTQDQDVARLLLDRPEARNAIPAAGWDALGDLLDTVSARLLVVAGAGGAFCAGADLTDFRSFGADGATRFRKAMRAALDRLAALEIPTIAVIDGPCYGAGVALALACDLRLALDAARFAITPAKLGISYPQEDIFRLVETIGRAQAARLLFTAATIEADEAVRIGLADRLDEADTIAAILASDSQSLATLKRGIALARRSDAEQDRRFDALLGGAEMARRLEALRRK